MPLHSNTTLYRPGDVVRVRDDLAPYESAHNYRDMIRYRMHGEIDGIVANKEMSKLRGKDVTVTRIVNTTYRISEDDGRYAWTDEMFSGYAEEETIPVPDIYYDSFDWGE